MKPRIVLLLPSRHLHPHFSRSSISTSTSALHTLVRQRTLQHRLRRAFATSPLTTAQPTSQIIRPLIPPPSENSGPLLLRRPDRALPSAVNTPLRTWAKTLPVFIALIVVSSLAIFNYQKSSSSTVNSILYALRTNATARELLGDEIYFASKVPWIRGELNQMHGRIDVSFWVKGTKGTGCTRFVSVRKRRDGFFETQEWSLAMEGGSKVGLLDEQMMANGGEGVVDLRNKRSGTT